MPGSNTSPAASFGLLALRVVTGLLLVVGHGWGKLTHFSTLGRHFGDPLHVGSERSLMLAIFAEVACAGLVAIGFATRFAAAALVFQFAVIQVLVFPHAPLSERELALLYGT